MTDYTISKYRRYRNKNNGAASKSNDGFGRFVFDPDKKYTTYLMGTKYFFDEIDMDHIKGYVGNVWNRIWRSDFSESSDFSELLVSDLSPIEAAALAFVSTHAFEPIRIVDWDYDRIKQHIKTLRKNGLIKMRARKAF